MADDGGRGGGSIKRKAGILADTNGVFRRISPWEKIEFIRWPRFVLYNSGMQEVFPMGDWMKAGGLADAR